MTYQNTNKVVVLAKIEATEGVDIVPTPVADAFLCSALDIKGNPTTLERNNYSPSLSHEKIGIGRIPVVLTFTHELKASGTLGTAPRIGRLFQACGFQQTTVGATAAATIATAAGSTNTGPAVVIGKTAAPTSRFDKYRLYVTTGGASGTAKVMMVSQGFYEGDAAVVASITTTDESISALGTVAIDMTAVVAHTITIGGTWAQYDIVEVFAYGIPYMYQVASGDTPTSIGTALAALIDADTRLTAASVAGVITLGLVGAAADTIITTAVAITLGNSGAQITPTWTGSLVVGDYYDITLSRPGVRYDPISDSIPSLTFYVYLDGTLHRMLGSRGTFKIDGKASEYAKVSFTFTGQYCEPVKAALPTTIVFEASKPLKCELMAFTILGMPSLPGETWSFDLGGSVNLRDDYNHDDGWNGVLLTDRKPMMMADPESTTPDNYNAWKRMRNSDVVRIHCLVGAKGGTGNKVRIQADGAQFNKADYKDRNKIRVWDSSFNLARLSDAGNDECSFHFG